MASTWTVACAQPTDARGDEQTPAPRYGHGAAIRDEIMTITHGYYFDHERCKPMFLDDTWEYHTTHKKWRYRSLGSVRPCKRFHVQYAWDSTHLYLFGGTDGGLRVNKGENFIFGPRAEFNDLWRLQLNEEAARWEKLHGGSDETYNAVEGQDVPRKAHMGGCACAAGKVYTFGGLCGDESEEPDGLEALGELSTSETALATATAPTRVWASAPELVCAWATMSATTWALRLAAARAPTSAVSSALTTDEPSASASETALAEMKAAGSAYALVRRPVML